ncbi:aminoacyl-tRNA hydrolase [Paenimyroides tangerinum]|uniref:Aminoacyl-tRNA hydrolase n=1 Tax=Paenimyroides tangerinum TaxID=2488728 RepID=A0A3P3W1L7_9FLAO|nr:alternative ribosome rescue aminoacyl-tRNA hydrolase ArfB [Paenimyroides tangerinum]RRJ88952.1 aminoacyl-tRNA hydrolase [Paenimyroides tangerinum]RRJ92328.1 aminoacyl-tRNA hydrolase [Paenimyroides tangerinum]
MNKTQLHTELDFKAVRSSGAGGQNVNKVSTKVILNWNSITSSGLSENQLILIREKLANRINKEGILILECDETRSQLKNKELVTKRFFYLLENALIVAKKRIATKIPKSVIRKRLNDKKVNSEKKQNRNFKF